jgi:hypothetical protein
MPPADRSTVPPATGAAALRLVDVLRQLPERELDSLIERLRIVTDDSKRIDRQSQVARALVSLPELRDTSQFPGPTRELLYRIAEGKGSLLVENLPAAVEPLVARGIVFARGCEGGLIELLLPIAYMVILRAWEGDDPRGARALISQVSPDVAASIAAHYLGRPATPPLALSLEPAWEALNDPERLRQEVEALAPLERKLLEAAERTGGEVETEELLDLEREPMRLRGATGATPSRRGVGFALERRGFLIPIHPNRHIIPSEVAAIVGARRQAEREAERRRIRSYVFGEDHEPRRARFAQDAVPLALAMALAVRDASVDVRPGVGTPRSLITRFAVRFGRDTDTVALVAALSRAIGLWDPSTVSVASPPGSYRVHELGRALFEAWRRGGAWDEARQDGEVLRATGEAREASAVAVVREMVLEALSELGDGRWAPWEAIEGYVRTDGRIVGITRLLERWALRSGVEPTPPIEIARRIALETLHELGVVDLGDPEQDGDGPTLRITPRGRAFIARCPLSIRAEPSRFLDNHALRIGPEARIGQVAALAPFVEVAAVGPHLDVVLTQQTLSLALAAGYETEVMRARLEAIATLPDPIERVFAQASAVIGRAEFVATGGFLWVEDNEIRELLRTRRQTADLFIDPSPPSGLLVSPSVDIERLVRRARALGVEVVVDGEVLRTRSTSQARAASGARRLDSSIAQPATNGRRSTGPRRRSSQNLPAIKRGSGS